MNCGYIVKPRNDFERYKNIFKNEPFTEREAWDDLLKSASHAIRTINKGEIIERGEVVTSTIKLAEKWQWTRKRVTTFLNKCFKAGLIKLLQFSKQFGLRIWIDNDEYDRHQPPRSQGEARKLESKRDNETHNEMSQHEASVYKALHEAPKQETHNEKNIYNNINNKNNSVCVDHQPPKQTGKVELTEAERKELIEEHGIDKVEEAQAKAEKYYSKEFIVYPMAVMRRFIKSCTGKQTQQQSRSNTPVQRTAPRAAKKPNSFNNFSQRTYDFKALEAKLFAK